MSGNVWEWTSSYRRGKKVLCGGSWYDVDPEELATSGIDLNRPPIFGTGTGFRCVRSKKTYWDAAE
jgi:formylglycine-generating enzyme required for sulfatase activity